MMTQKELKANLIKYLITIDYENMAYIEIYNHWSTTFFNFVADNTVIECIHLIEKLKRYDRITLKKIIEGVL